MGYFAVLMAAENDQVVVNRCHLNLWSLPGLWPGRRLLYVDVGLELRAGGSRSIESIDLLLPFRAESGSWPDGSKSAQDLYDVLGRRDEAELIFGGPVQVSQQSGRLSLDVSSYGQALAVHRIDAGGVAPVPTYEERPDSSLYRVQLQEPIAAGASGYIRMRWRVLEAGQMWRAQRWRDGARLDFRICDVRESQFAAQERALRPRICEVAEVNFFLVVSPILDEVSSSPSFKKRTLETGAWRSYLSGASYVGFSRGLNVYSCKYSSVGSASSARLSADNPTRFYLSLAVRTRRTSLNEFMRTLFAVLIASILVSLVTTSGVSTNAVIGILAAQVYTIVGLLGLTTVFGLVRRLRGWVATRFLRQRRRIRAIERGLLRVTQLGS